MDRKPTLGMEPSERRALEIMRVAMEQSDEIVKLSKAVDDVTKQCREAEIRVREACAQIVLGFPLNVAEQECCPTELGRIHARDLVIYRMILGGGQKHERD